MKSHHRFSRLVAWVRAHRSRPRRAILGLAIGPERVVAVELGAGLLAPRVKAVHERSLAPAEPDGSWPDLADALRELMSELRVGRAAAYVALLRPVANAKVLRLPPLGRTDLRSLVSRHARRFFIVGAEPVRADAIRLRRGRRGQAVPAAAVWADPRRIDVIEEALHSAGIEARVMTAASLALAETIARRVPTARRGRAVVAVASRGWREGIALRRGKVDALHPWSASGSWEPEQLVTNLFAGTPGEGEPAGAARGVVVADAEGRDALTDVLTRTIGQPPAEVAGLAGLDPAALAAYGAALVPEDAPALTSEATRRNAGDRVRRRVVTLGTVAAVLLMAAGTLHLVGLNRELRSVMDARRAIRGDAEQAMEMRRLVVAVQDRLAALATVEDDKVAWTPALAALAEALPDSAYLVSMSAEGIDIRLAGLATTASSVVPALESSPLLRNVSLSLARRSEGVRDRERFDVALVLDPRPGSERPEGDNQ